ncbi:MAG: hypothetical protein HY287_05475 [Planctomycetes bacterium]|nr:hypothetical protein [Planctomycetota bacterium]MBI3833761.1 hypothetical protein [Planctomycetota bacterium]
MRTSIAISLLSLSLITGGVAVAQPELSLGTETVSSARRGFPPPLPPSNRYLNINFPSNLGVVAFRVTFISLMHPSPPNVPEFPPPDFTAYEGQVRWVGPVMDCQAIEVPPTTFKCALLQCEPYYDDFYASVGNDYLYITGSAVVPSSRYELQFFAPSCQGHEDSCAEVSLPDRRDTLRWGDVAYPYQDPGMICSVSHGSCRSEADCPPGNTCDPVPLFQPNITDVAAVVDRFKGLDTGAPVWLADMNPQTPDFKVNISDVASTVDAFKGLAYPFQIDGCP